MMRKAFSLLEIIIATAILAASAMVLTSLIGLGTTYGNRAEERTIAISQAESLLDEFLAQLSEQSTREQVTGELPGPPSRGFRITATAFNLGDSTAPRTSGESAKGAGGDRAGGLLQVTVEIFDSNSTNSSGASKPLAQLSRLIRRPSLTEDSTLGLSQGTLQ